MLPVPPFLASGRLVWRWKVASGCKPMGQGKNLSRLAMGLLLLPSNMQPRQGLSGQNVFHFDKTFVVTNGKVDISHRDNTQRTI